MISLVAGSQPEGLITAAARMQPSIAALEAQIAVQQQALAQLAGAWQGVAADAAMARAEKKLEQQHELQVRRRQRIRSPI